MLKVTPVPPAPVVASTDPMMTEPVALSKLVEGRMAWYVACGLFAWTVAFPPGPTYVNFGAIEAGSLTNQ